MEETLGFVETCGLIAAIEAADAMNKAARVRVKTVCNADAALISVICTGDLASCKAAVDAGKSAASRVGDVVNSLIIARADVDTSKMVDHHLNYLFTVDQDDSEDKSKPQSKPQKKK